MLPIPHFARQSYLIAVILHFAISPYALCASDNAPQLANYVRTRFSTEQGLFSNLVDDIVQSSDGLLWLRVSGIAIASFDGERFRAYGDLGSVRSLALSPSGDLWVGTGDDLRQIRKNDLELLGHWPFLSYCSQLGRYVSVIHFARDGVLWMGTNRGLLRFANGVCSAVIPGLSVERIEETASGHLWITISDGAPIEWDGKHALQHKELAAQLGLKDAEIFHVLEDRHGVTWICTKNGVARRAGDTMEKLQPWGRKGRAVYRAYEAPDGMMLFAGEEGMYQLALGRLDPVAPGMQVRRMFGDRDGNLWVGTNGDGLYRFKQSAIRTYTTEDGLPNKVVMTVLTAHDGTLWAGFNCGGIMHFDGSVFRTYNQSNGLLEDCVWSLAEGANRDLWIGTWGGGLFRLREGKFTQYSSAQGLAGNVVQSVVVARDGSIWLTASGWVSRIRNGQIRNYTTADGLDNSGFRRVYADESGGIWVASERTLEHLVGDRFEHFAIPGKARIGIIGQDDGGALYFSCYTSDEQQQTYRKLGDQLVQVIPDRTGSELLRTKEGDFWLFASHGIYRFPPDSLDHAHGEDEPLDYETFGSLDGLPATISGGHPTVALASDSKLWIATTQGLVLLDLTRTAKTVRKPTIYVEGITFDRTQERAGLGELVLPAGTHHLELSFNAIEITSPEKIRLQYRMDGVDPEWLDATAPGRAVYSTLPAGKHALHLRATNRSGIWDRTGVEYFVTQEPYFYQTYWFMAACIALGLLAIVAVYRLRLGQAVARANLQLDERLNERTRIARDLHDTLLQSFNALLLRLQTVSNVLPASPDEAKRRIDAAIEQASEAITEGRDAVHELRSVAEATMDLDQAISSFAKELRSGPTAESAPEIYIEVQGKPRLLKPEARDEVFRIAAEALRNAIRHAHAGRVEVEIRYDEHQLGLRIKDDGKGIDPVILGDGRSLGHWGLHGMRERAKLVEGTLEVRSQVGVGTEISVKIPAANIYAKSPSSPWPVSRFRRG